MSGWIKLHRQLTEWEWFKDHKTFHLFTYILLSANHEKTRFMGHDIPAGAFVSGLLSMAENTGLSQQNIRTSLKKLSDTGEITIKTTNKFSIISIVNWKKYQDANKQLTNDQQTTNKPLTTDKESKNIRIKEYIPPEGVAISVWQDFVNHRKKKRADITETVMARIKYEADKAGWSLEDALAEICLRGWTGFKSDWVTKKTGKVAAWFPS